MVGQTVSRVWAFGWESIIKPCLPQVAIGAVLYLATNAPKVGNYLRYDMEFQVYLVPSPNACKRGVFRGEIPVWGLLVVLVALTTLGTWIRLYRDAQEPKLRRFSVRGLIWELTPLFFYVYKKEESPDDVDDLIKGPYCPNCQQSLQGESGGIDWVPRTRVIEHPCPNCGFNHDWLGMYDNGRLFTIEVAKKIVYREAQRQARLGDLRP
jgi:hypothetical protein